jgi:hypothetical protein
MRRLSRRCDDPEFTFFRLRNSAHQAPLIVIPAKTGGRKTGLIDGFNGIFDAPTPIQKMMPWRQGRTIA